MQYVVRGIDRSDVELLILLVVKTLGSILEATRVAPKLLQLGLKGSRNFVCASTHDMYLCGRVISVVKVGLVGLLSGPQRVDFSF